MASSHIKMAHAKRQRQRQPVKALTTHDILQPAAWQPRGSVSPYRHLQLASQARVSARLTARSFAAQREAEILSEQWSSGDVNWGRGMKWGRISHLHSSASWSELSASSRPSTSPAMLTSQLSPTLPQRAGLSECLRQRHVSKTSV